MSEVKIKLECGHASLPEERKYARAIRRFNESTWCPECKMFIKMKEGQPHEILLRHRVS